MFNLWWLWVKWNLMYPTKPWLDNLTFGHSGRNYFPIEEETAEKNPWFPTGVKPSSKLKTQKHFKLSTLFLFVFCSCMYAFCIIIGINLVRFEESLGKQMWRFNEIVFFTFKSSKTSWFQGHFKFSATYGARKTWKLMVEKGQYQYEVILCQNTSLRTSYSSVRQLTCWYSKTFI